MNQIISPLIVILIVVLNISFVDMKQQKIKLRYKFVAEKVYTRGICPDTIKATVYDAETDKVLYYNFKNTAQVTKNGFYYTIKSSKKDGLISGQIIDCAMKTIATISVVSQSLKGDAKLTVKTYK